MELTYEAQHPDRATTRQQSKGDRRVAECPECEREIPLAKRAGVGDRIECPGCGERLEIISLRPPELDYVFGDGDFDEDWEEDE